MPSIQSCNPISWTCLLFRERRTFSRAIIEYEVTIKIHGPIVMYLSNMAAAWLKLEA